MTLEEMLALLPDNNNGEIVAGDLRTVVTGLYEISDALRLEVQNLGARVAVLEATGGGSGGGNGNPSITAGYQVNPQAGQVPGGHQVTSDTGLVSTASWMRFDRFDQASTDMSYALMNVDHLFLQLKSDAANWARLEVTGPAVQQGSYVQVPVAWITGAGSIGAISWQNAIVVMGFDA